MKSSTYHNDNTMWPVIFVALAISYVICVLLLGGLQKEDLDANTLEKLKRHNVNIYDMNNESLQGECLSDTPELGPKGTNDLAEQQKYMSAIMLNEQNSSNLNSTDNHKPQIFSRQFSDIANVSNLLDETKINYYKVQNNYDNIKDNPDTTTNVEQNTENIKVNNPSSLETILNLWNKISHHTTETVPHANRTIDLTQVHSTAPTIQHSKDIDFVDRMIAEYLATQPASIPIPSITEKSNKDIVSENIIDFLGQHYGETKKPEQLRSFVVNGYGNRKMDHQEKKFMLNLDIVNSIPINKNKNYTTQKPLRTYGTPPPINNLYNYEQLERLKDIQYIDDINSKNKENIQNQEADQYLDEVLRFSKQFNIDIQIPQIPYLEKNIKNIIKNKNEKEQISRNIMLPYITEAQNNMIKGSSKNQSNEIHSDHVGMGSVGVTNAQLEKIKDMEHIGDINNKNKEIMQKQEALHYLDDILRFRKQFNIDLQIPYSENSSQNRFNDEIEREQISRNKILTYINDAQNNIKDSSINQSIRIPSDFRRTVSVGMITTQLERLKDVQYTQDTLNRENQQKQTALQYLNDNFRLSKQFNIDTEILDKEKNSLNRISNENERQQISRNNILSYISEVQNDNVKDSIKNHGNGIPSDHGRTVSAGVINALTVRLKDIKYISDINTMNRENIQKQAALQYLDDIVRFSKQFNTRIPYSEKSTQKIDYEKERSQMSQNTIINNSSKIQSNAEHSDNLVPVSANVINEIAKKVKEIVMTDLRRDIPVAHVSTTTTNTMIATTAPVIATSIKENLTMLQKQADESEVRKTLIEILKEYKTLKERDNKQTTAITNALLPDEKYSVQNVTSHPMNPPATTESNTHDLRKNIAKIEQKNMNPYMPSLLAVPWVYPEQSLQTNQTNLYSKNNYRLPPITVQTNSDVIPPLAIQISNPMELTNQHIISPSVNVAQLTINKQSNQNFTDLIHTVKRKNHHIDYPVYEGRTRTFNTADIDNKSFRYSYKDRIQKLQDRIKYASEQIKGVDPPTNSEYRNSVSGVEKPSHYSFGKFSVSNPETNLHRRKYPYQPLDSQHHERHIPTKYENYLSLSRNWQRRDNFRRPLDISSATLNKPMDFKYLNDPLETKHRQLLNERLDSNPHKVEPRPRDVVTHEVLSRLVDSHYHGLLNHLISIPAERMKRPITDQYHESDHLKDYIRNEQYPKVSKYHEKLEQSDNLSSNSFDSYIRKMTTQSFGDGIGSRQQMPLGNMNQQRTSFDDTHFKNFLKSQQKVTDILEKILATKTKPDLQSVESV